MSEQVAEQNNPEAEDSARPEWLPENFNTPEDFVKSYKEIEGARTRDRQEFAELKSQLAEFKQAWEQQTAPTPPDPTEQWSEQTGLDPETIRAVAQVADYVAKQNLTQYQQQAQSQTQAQAEQQNHLLAYTADQIVRGRNDDWNDYKDKVGAAIAEDPDLLPASAFSSPEATAKALERVYKLVKADDVYNQIQSGTHSVDQGRQNKLNAQTMSGATGRPGETTDDDQWFERLKAAHQTGYSGRMGGV